MPEPLVVVFTITFNEYSPVLLGVIKSITFENSPSAVLNVPLSIEHGFQSLSLHSDIVALIISLPETSFPVLRSITISPRLAFWLRRKPWSLDVSWKGIASTLNLVILNSESFVCVRLFLVTSVLTVYTPLVRLESSYSVDLYTPSEVSVKDDIISAVFPKESLIYVLMFAPVTGRTFLSVSVATVTAMTSESSVL